MLIGGFPLIIGQPKNRYSFQYFFYANDVDWSVASEDGRSGFAVAVTLLLLR